MIKNPAGNYFPENYIESRKNFRNLVEQISAPYEAGSWKIPSATDDDLEVDFVWLPATKKPKNMLVLLTGIHGSETYAGSAVLKLFLSEMLPEIDRSQLGLFIVHAMNPYGFKNHRRCTENKVNLNRNFSVSGELFKTRNPEAQRLNELFISRKPVSSLRSSWLDSLNEKNSQIYFGDVSMDELIKALSPGQFERADDHEYGGQKPEPQTEALINKMKELMPSYENIVALDIHTGLGHRGRLHLLTDGEGASLNGSLFDRIFKPDMDKKYYEYTPPSAEGFYSVKGATNSMFSDLASENQAVCAVTLEFGTLGHSSEQQLSDLNLSSLDHQGYHYGFENSDLEHKIRALNLEKSYPDDDIWRSDILLAAEGLIKNVIQRLKS